MSKRANIFIIFVAIAFAAFGIFAVLRLKHTIVLVNEAATPITQEVLRLPEPPQENQELKEVLPKSNPQLRILNTSVGYVNVRDAASLQGKRIGRVSPKDIYEYTEEKDGWYHILIPEKGDGWVFGEYIEKVDRSKDLFQNEPG